MPQLSMHSPIGDITISEEDGVIVSIDWGWARDQKPTPLLKNAKKQLDAYFDGELEEFESYISPLEYDWYVTTS